MKIALTVFGATYQMGDNLDRWTLFADALSRLGCQFTDLSDPDSEVYVSIDHHRESLRKVRRNIPKSKRVLILREPVSVNPTQYRCSILNNYQYVYSANLDLTDPLFKIFPDGYLNSSSPNFDGSLAELRPYFLSFLGENKFSLHPKSLYKFRQKCIKTIANSSVQLRLGGRYWETGLSRYVSQQLFSIVFLIKSLSAISLSQFRIPLSNAEKSRILLVGYVDNAHHFYEQSKFVLVIENEKSELSEKLFNAIGGGSIPIYFGCDLKTILPEISNLVFQFKNQEELLEILERISSMSESQIAYIRSSLQNVYCDPRFRNRWSENISMVNLASFVANDLL
jgi:hypothetical protein